MNIIEGIVSVPDANIAIVVSRFNHFINKNLLHGAIDTLKRIGHIKDMNITVVWVPGAYELPLTINILASIKKYDAIIALGTIIKGETNHFELIASESNTSLSKISINNRLPIACGILTTENIEQAIERAGSKMGNKGAEAALVALEMINVLRSISSI